MCSVKRPTKDLAQGALRKSLDEYHLERTTMSEGLVCLQRELQEEKRRCKISLGDYLLEVRYENT